MSKIEWTGETWNPVVGCSVLSPGCTNCYAMKMAARLEHMARQQNDTRTDPTHGGKTWDSPLNHYVGLTKRTKAGPVWTGRVALAPHGILTKPLAWKKSRTIFVCSMTDLFHEDVPDAWIDRVFAVMALSPQHTFQVLTKRSARMLEYIARAAQRVHSNRPALSVRAADDDRPTGSVRWQWPLPNVWLGVSAERQIEADARIPDLLATPAAVRFVSAEPLLGPIDFTRITLASPRPSSPAPGGVYLDALRGVETWVGYAGASLPAPPPDDPALKLDWVIVGGESGPGARSMHPDWARTIRDQCNAAGVPFFFKQWGAWVASRQAPGLPVPDGIAPYVMATNGAISSGDKLDGCDARDKPKWVAISNVGKARAGRLLDGREWNEMPRRSPVLGSATGADAGREAIEGAQK